MWQIRSGRLGRPHPPRLRWPALSLALVLALSLALILASCAKKRQTSTTLLVFGTLVELTLYDVDQPTADRAIAEVSANFSRQHKNWHAWRKGELHDLNRAFAGGSPAPVSAEMAAILRQATALERASKGLFNPAIGRLIALWGFHQDEAPKGPPPDREQIAALVKARPSMSDITIEQGVARSDNRAVQLDFGAFGKGAALDRATSILRDHGIQNALLNAGGDLNVLGRRGARPWRIGIRHPKHWGIIASVSLEGGETLYTSGNYHRFRTHEGVHYSHIIDPRTGWPVDHIVSASVIHQNGALADAAATALSVAGPKHWLETARTMGLRHVLLVDRSGGLYMTPAMQKRLNISDREAKIIEVKDPFATGATP